MAASAGTSKDGAENWSLLQRSFPADSERRRDVGLGLPASTLDSKIKALKIDKRRYQNP
jgi:hypothetical protein